MTVRFRYGDRWLALQSVPASAKERAALEGRDRQIEDYVSEIARLTGTGVPSGLTTFQPTFGGVTVGDGTTGGGYATFGPFTYIRVRFTLGATSAITGPITISAPAGMVPQADSMLKVRFNDVAPAGEYIGTGIRSGSVIELRPHASTTYATYDHASSTVPFTWAAGDWFSVSGWIEPT